MRFYQMHKKILQNGPPIRCLVTYLLLLILYKKERKEYLLV